MAKKSEKPWVWDLDTEQKYTRKFCENFARTDPIFTQWADCLYSICVKEAKIRDYSKHEKGYEAPPKAKKERSEVPVKKSDYEPEDTNDPIVNEMGKLLAAEPEREADRLKYLMLIFNESSALDHEGAGYTLNSIIGVSLEYKAKRQPN